MPTFSYKGYDFEVDHTPTEAEFAQMSAYVDTLPTKAPAKQKRDATWGESLAQGAAQVGNTADLAWSTLAGGAAALFGDKQAALDIEEQRKNRKETRDTWGSPQETEQSFPQKAVNALNPMSLVTSGLSPASTVDVARQAGETNTAALKAGAVDAAGNIVGMVIPGFKQGSAAVRAATGAAANVAQEYATKKIIQDMLDTEEGKKQFEVTPEGLALAGLTGGTMAAAAGAKSKGKTKGPATPTKALFDDVDTTPAPVKTPMVEPEQLKLFDQFEERSPISKYQTEMAPDMWRVDENGIPIRADLSMEVQNLQQPLQRNLFGDELDVNFPRDPNEPLSGSGNVMRDTDLEMNSRPLTEAIDSMPEGIRNRENGKFAQGTTRQSALDLLRNELPAGNELEAAKLVSEGTAFSQWLEENKKAPSIARKGRIKKQGGGVLANFSKNNLQDLLEEIPYRFQALEGLPNKGKVTYEQIKQIINREGVSGAEKQIIKNAYSVALFTSDADFVSAKDFADGLKDVIQGHELSRKPSGEYADYGLNNIGRDAVAWEPIPRAEWTPEQVNDYHEYNIFPKRKVLNSKSGAVPETNIWSNSANLSEGVRNHFDDPSYVGHTRNFKENGVRHVVEIQSDLAQNYKKAGRAALKNNTVLEIADHLQSTKDHLKALAKGLNGDIKAYEEYAQSNPSFSKWMEGRDAVDAQETLERTRQVLERELTLRSNAKTTDSFAKNWNIRLIREELADAAKNGEKSVRFATADTMAKVEGWEDNHEYAQRHLRDLESSIRAAEDQKKSQPFRATFLDRHIAELSRQLERVKEDLAGPKFDLSVQGIYDRYQKEVHKYLTSIGGQMVTDEKGASWIEVPVDEKRKRPIMFGQRGAVLVDWGKKKEVDSFGNIPGVKDALRDIGHSMIDSPEQAISLAQKFSDVSQNTAQKAISYLTKGGIYLKGKVNNPVVHYTVDRFLDAEGKAKAEVNEKVHSGYVAELRSLSKEQYKQAAELLNGADLRKMDLTPELMTKHGVDPKVQSFVQLHQDLMNDALGKMNEALVASGKKPVEARNGYSAMNMTGDYRKVAYKTIDGVKTVVGVISADRKAGKLGWTLDKVEKEMLSRDPTLEFVALPDRSAGSGKGSPHEAFQDALNTIGKDNPHMQEFLATLQEVAKSDAATYMGMQKHSLGKKGIWGMEGRKPWMNEAENATAFFENQAKYLENTYNWAALADAARDVNTVLRDEGVATKHGEAIKLSEQYMAGAMGLNPDKLGRAVDKAFDALGDKVGIGPSNLRSTIGMGKRLANTMMLSLNPSFLGIQIVQGPVGIPAMTALLRGRGLAPGRSILTGGLDSFAEAGITLMKSKVSPGSLNAFDKAALKYAKDNHIYATDMVEHANQTQKGAGFYLTKATQSPAAIVESGTRAQVYMAFVKMMQDSGMSQKDGLFQQAHRVTDMVMNNYSAMEKPRVYDALGPIGSMAYNLKSFAHNEISRWSLYARELGATGNAAPLLTQMAITIALAGVMGLPFYSQWESLYDYITKKLGNPRSLTLDVINMSEDLAAKMGPDYDKWKFAVSHGLSTIAGADVSKRVGLGDVLPSKASDAAFAGGGKLADMAGTAAGLMGSPDEAHAKAAAVAWTPSMISAPLKEAWYTDEDTAYSMDPDKPRRAVARLNATDKLLKSIGISGINESVQKERNYQLGVLDKTYQDYRDSAMTKMVYSLAMGQPLSPADVKKYVETGQGDPNTLMTQLTTAIDGLQKTPEEKQLLKIGTTQSITQLMSLQRRLDNR